MDLRFNQCCGRRVSVCDSRNIAIYFVFDCHPKKKIFVVIQFHHSRKYQFWDYDPQVGLVQAGGISPYSNSVTRSQDNGVSAETLSDFSQLYTTSCSGSAFHYAGCVVIINETTVFGAGGRSEYKCGGNLIWVFNL